MNAKKTLDALFPVLPTKTSSGRVIVVVAFCLSLPIFFFYSTSPGFSPLLYGLVRTASSVSLFPLLSLQTVSPW